MQGGKAPLRCPALNRLGIEIINSGMNRRKVAIHNHLTKSPLHFFLKIIAKLPTFIINTFTNCNKNT